MPPVKKDQIKAEEVKPVLSQSTNNSDDEEGSEESEEEWWEKEDLNVAKRGEKRWDTLCHNGPTFPEEYVPHGVPMRYEGRPLALAPAAEEVATMFAAMTEVTQYYHNEVFRKNFFTCFKKVLNQSMPGHPVRELTLCDFTPIYAHVLVEKDKRKNLSNEVKKAKLLANAEMDKKYKFCMWDGRPEELAAYRIEPPGLFRGRGKHPLQGMLKRRVVPEDVTINIGSGEKVPECPAGHSWKAVIHDQHVTWLAMWQDNVTGGTKYVMMGANSSVKGMSDREKFERARRLKDKVVDIRKDYESAWTSSSVEARQLGVALYFIDFLALRVGNEKGDDEADTYGCCSLMVDHVKPMENNVLRFDFPGKDSIQYVNDVTVNPIVYDLIKSFRQQKTKTADLFDHVSPQSLNNYLKKHMSDLTAKVFRTYNASICLQDRLAINPPPKSAPITEKLVHFNKCNTEVAILCNHQRTLPKNYNAKMHKLGGEADNMSAALARVERAQQTAKSKGMKAAVTEFFADEDKAQWEWLNLYGTDAEKAEYKKLIKERDIDAIASRAGGSKTKKASSSSSSSKKDSSKGTKSVSTPKNKSKASIKAEDDSDADEDLLALVARNAKKATPKKASPKKAAVKKEVKKEESSEEEDDDEDEQPTKKKTRAASAPKAKAAAPKKASPKKAAPKKGGKK